MINTKEKWVYAGKKLNVLFLLFVLVATLSCVKKERPNFTFVQLCDTQIGVTNYDEDIASFEQAVRQINELDPDFTVICGDLVQNAADSSLQDAKKIIDKLKSPCYVAPGNHDIGKVPTDDSLRKYREIFGRDYFEFKNKGCSFLVTNTLLWRVNMKKESLEHEDWFKRKLAMNYENQLPTVVVGHYPLFVKDPEEKNSGKNIPFQERQRILKLLDSYSVKVYLSGHLHQYRKNSYKKTIMVSGESTAKNKNGSPLGFQLWEISNNCITNHFVSLVDSDSIAL